MNYTIRWIEPDGFAQETARDTYDSAILLAAHLDSWAYGVEILDENGRLVWPFRGKDADL